MNKKCEDCENALLLEVSDLTIELEKQRRWIQILQKCIDVKDELLELYRDECETLSTKYKLLKEVKNETQA